MLRDMDNPYQHMGVICHKLFNGQSFRRKISTLFRKFECRRLRIGWLSIKGKPRNVCPDNLKSFVLYTYHKMPALHVGDSRHVRYHIILLVPTEGVFQILKFLPFAASILLWVLAENVLL